MKTCIQCGRELKDAANFCPSCGAAQLEEGPQTDKWGVPLPSGAGKNATAQQPRGQRRQTIEPEISAPSETPETAPSKPAKKGGLKWWLIAVPVLLAALVGIGLYASRVSRASQPYRELVSYYEDDTYDIEFYDADGHVTGCQVFDQKGRMTREEKYSDTEAAEAVNTLDVLMMPGVETVECREILSRVGTGGVFRSTELFYAIGYDAQDNLCAAQLYYHDGDRMILMWTREFENDSHGNMVKAVRTVGNGDVLDVYTFDNTYSFGRLAESEVHVEENGTPVFEDGEYVLGPREEDTEPTWDYRVEYRYN